MFILDYDANFTRAHSFCQARIFRFSQLFSKKIIARNPASAKGFPVLVKRKSTRDKENILTPAAPLAITRRESEAKRARSGAFSRSNPFRLSRKKNAPRGTIFFADALLLFFAFGDGAASNARQRRTNRSKQQAFAQRGHCANKTFLLTPAKR